MPSSNNEENLSFEVTNDGSMSVDMMMQQGMQALSKILTDQLQDSGGVSKYQRAIQDLLGEESQSSGRNLVKKLQDSDPLQSDGLSHKTNHTAVNFSSENLDDVISDPELHLDAEEGEIIFDYGTQELTGSPNKIGEHITQMLESVLPNGIQNGAQGRLHAVVNGDELKITEDSFIDLQEAMTSLRHIQTVKQRQQPVNNSVEGLKAIDESGTDESITKEEFQRQGGPSSKKTVSHHNTEAKEASSFGYEYPLSTRRAPNFTALINERRPLCLFCEYYMVFGEPPINMIKWYNKTHDYDKLPGHTDKEQQKNRRKRSR